ncbi:MAG: helix-turn-helix domain-containing protein [Fimbriimonadaceae bacterium]
MRIYGKNNFRKARIYVDYHPTGWNAMSLDIDYVMGEGESFHIALEDFLDQVNVRWGDLRENDEERTVPFVDLRTPLIRTDIFPEHLARFRRACGLSKKKMSEESGLSLATIAKIEKEIRDVRFADANAYLEVLAEAANLAVVSVDLYEYPWIQGKK